MGNPLKSITQTLTKLDPITHAVSPGGKYDAFNTTTGAAAPPYNPNNNPGAHLTPAPGGVTQLPTTGASPGGSPNGYTPNYWQQPGMGLGNSPATNGANIPGQQARPGNVGMQAGAPRPGMSLPSGMTFPGSGGTPQRSTQPIGGMSQQMAIVNQLRQNRYLR